MNKPSSPTQRSDLPARMFARLPTVVQATGLGRSTIYRLVENGSFFLDPCIWARVPSPGVGQTWIDGASRTTSI